MPRRGGRGGAAPAPSAEPRRSARLAQVAAPAAPSSDAKGNGEGLAASTSDRRDGREGWDANVDENAGRDAEEAPEDEEVEEGSDSMSSSSGVTVDSRPVEEWSSVDSGDEDSMGVSLEDDNEARQFRLFHAAGKGDVKAMMHHISRGAKPKYIDVHGYEAMTPAIESGNPEAVALLLRHGVSRNRMYPSHTLATAVVACTPRTLEVLLDAGADIMFTGDHGELALEACLAQEGDAARECVELLAAAFVDVAQRETPSHNTRYLRAVVRASYPAAPFALYGGAEDLWARLPYTMAPKDHVAGELGFHVAVRTDWLKAGVDIPGLFLESVGIVAWLRRRGAVLAAAMGFLDEFARVERVGGKRSRATGGAGAGDGKRRRGSTPR